MTTLCLDMAHTWLAFVPDSLTSHLTQPDSWTLAQTWHGLWDNLLWQGQVLAQQFDTDVFAGFRRTMSNFIQSGQIWALLIGMVIGYILRGITTYN